MYKVKRQINAPIWVRPVRHEPETHQAAHKRFDKIPNKKYYEVVKVGE